MTEQEKKEINLIAQTLEITITTDQFTLLSNPNINVQKFVSWLEKVDLSKAISKQKYFNAMFNNTIQTKTWRKEQEDDVSFDDDTITNWHNHQQMFNTMRMFGIEVKQIDTIYVQSYVDYMVYEKGVNDSTIRDLNIKVMTYMFNNRNKCKDYSSTTFISLLKKSSFLGDLGVDWDKVDKMYQESIDEWREIWGNTI